MVRGFPRAHRTMTDLLAVAIYTPEGTLWSGDAESVSSVNSEGPFDILPDHANFLTLIARAPISIVAQDGMKEFSLERAVLYISGNVVSVYASVRTPSDVPGHPR